MFIVINQKNTVFIVQLNVQLIDPFSNLPEQIIAN